MSQNLTYIAVFKTNFIDEKFAKIVAHPVKIEFFTGPRSYQVPVQVAHKFSCHEEQLVARTRILQLDDEFHIEIKVRTREKDATLARRFCEAQVGESISLLSAIYSFHIFDELIYKGWIIEGETGVLGGWVQIIDESKYTVDANE